MDSRLCYSEANITSVAPDATASHTGAKSMQTLGGTEVTSATVTVISDANASAPICDTQMRSEWCSAGVSPGSHKTGQEEDHVALVFKEPANSQTSQSQCVCHPQKPDPTRNRARNKLIVACAMALFFMIGEALGGYFANSLAIMTDAAHMLSDFGGFLISLFALWVGGRPPSKNMSFGWHRAEVVGAVVSVLVIWVLTGVLVYEAILRIINQEYEIDADVMLITACVGVGVNLFMMGVLGHGHSHGGGGHGHSHGGGGHGHSHGGGGHGHSHGGGGHGHSHGGGHAQGVSGDGRQTGTIGDGKGGKKAVDEHRCEGGDHSHEEGGVGNKCVCGSDKAECICKDKHAAGDGGTSALPKKKQHSENINVKAAFIHVIGDLIQSVGVVIAGYIIKFRPDWKIADPICTFLFSVLVLFSTINILRDALLVLMEATPRHINYEGVLEDLSNISGVRHAHSLHIWSLTTNKITLSAHLVLDEEALGQEVLNLASAMLRNKYGIDQSALQVEEYHPAMDECSTCTGPA